GSVSIASDPPSASPFKLTLAPPEDCRPLTQREEALALDTTLRIAEQARIHFMASDFFEQNCELDERDQIVCDLRFSRGSYFNFDTNECRAPQNALRFLGFGEETGSDSLRDL